jgi:hypothetical protein
MKKYKSALNFSRNINDTLKVEVGDVVAWLYENKNPKLAEEFVKRSSKASGYIDKKFAKREKERDIELAPLKKIVSDESAAAKKQKAWWKVDWLAHKKEIKKEHE